jgi:hypothetical protein
VVNDALYSAPYDYSANQKGYYRLWAGVYHLGEPKYTYTLVPQYKLYFTDGSRYDLPMDSTTQKQVWGTSCCVVQPYGGFYQLQPDNYSNEYCGAFKHESREKMMLGDKPCGKYIKGHICKYHLSTAYKNPTLPSKLSGSSRYYSYYG